MSWRPALSVRQDWQRGVTLIGGKKCTATS